MTDNKTTLNKCYNCDCLFNEDSLKTGLNDNFYCECCFDDLFSYCEKCEEYFYKEDIYSFDGCYYCDDCLNKISCVCDRCGERFNHDDINFCEDCDINFCHNCDCHCSDRESSSNLNNIKIPFLMNKSKTFKQNPFKDFCGVEIECLNNDLSEYQFNRDDLIKNQFSQVEDGSLNSLGVEFVSNVFNGDLLFNCIKNMCGELNNKEFYVNQSCGLHVHIKVNKRIENLKKILLFYKKYEDYFYYMVSDSRINNNYSFKYNEKYYLNENEILNLKSNTELKKRLYKTKKYSNVKYWTKEKYNNLRYGWFNLHSIFYRGTLEIRLHQGTLNPIKINNWLKIHLTVLNLLKNIPISLLNEFPKNPKFFLSFFDDDLKKYIIDRWLNFCKNELKLIDGVKIENLKLNEVNN